MSTSSRSPRWFLIIFGAIFFCAGLAVFVFSIAPALKDIWRIQQWDSTQASLTAADLEWHTGDDSTTYQAVANYRYQVNGVEYHGNRVGIHEGADNIGDFHQRVAAQLKQHLNSQQPITVYYNPNLPSDSILNKEPRWGMMAFKSVFVLVFGGFGAAILWAGLRYRHKPPKPSVQELASWCRNAAWRDNHISANAKGRLLFIWFFALFWCAVSSPAAFSLQEIYHQQGMLVLLVLMFPLIGVGLLCYAVKITLEWRRFGETPLKLNPFPGQIGGRVAGEIQLAVNLPANAACKVTLDCIRSYITGSGKNRSRNESVLWQDQGYAQIQNSSSQCRLLFGFNVPENLPASEEPSNNYHLWRLTVHADISGVDLERHFEIPVFVTSNSAQTDSVVHSLDSTRYTPPGVEQLSAHDLLPLVSATDSRLEWFYPMLRDPISGVAISLFGGVFTAVGIMLWNKAASGAFMLYFMGSIFGLVGGLILLWGLFYLFNSLHVRFDQQRICSTRYCFGILVQRKQASYSQIVNVTVERGMQSNQGRQHKLDYYVIANTSTGEIRLAEQIRSDSQAQMVADFLRQQLGLVAKNE